MATYQIFKETALPGTLVANGIYLITAANADYVEMYVTDNAGAATRRIPTEADIQALINSSVASLASVEVVPNIAARDALTLTANTKVWVVDATADTTVDNGGAEYLWDNTNSVFIKTSEFESMDVILNWADIVGGPSSTPAAIDAAVLASHTHANKTELDKITEDVDGFAAYAGDSLVVTGNIAW